MHCLEHQPRTSLPSFGTASWDGAAWQVSGRKLRPRPPPRPTSMVGLIFLGDPLNSWGSLTPQWGAAPGEVHSGASHC